MSIELTTTRVDLGDPDVSPAVLFSDEDETAVLELSMDAWGRLGFAKSLTLTADDGAVVVTSNGQHPTMEDLDGLLTGRARRVLDSYTSVEEIRDASDEELLEIKGVGHGAITQIREALAQL